ncbi:serine hydrolase domain-containing protein, partial [Thiotrichales bacterium HSG1]|nr:serine hydrolase domain-containing protein [Thiotrichales bacterium HSG1]
GHGCIYSNINYIIAGLLIEKISGLPVEEVIYQQILKPLKLCNTEFIKDIKDIPASCTHGFMDYEGNGNFEDVTYIDQSVMWAAGAMMSNVDDLIIANKAQLEGRFIGHKLLKERLKTIPISKPIAPWWGTMQVGLGIQRISQDYLGHYGAFNGYECCTFYNFQKDISIATNINFSSLWGQRVYTPSIFKAILQILEGTWTGNVRIFSRDSKNKFSYFDKKFW